MFPRPSKQAGECCDENHFYLTWAIFIYLHNTDTISQLLFTLRREIYRLNIWSQGWDKFGSRRVDQVVTLTARPHSLTERERDFLTKTWLNIIIDWVKLWNQANAHKGLRYYLYAFILTNHQEFCGQIDYYLLLQVIRKNVPAWEHFKCWQITSV